MERQERYSFLSSNVTIRRWVTERLHESPWNPYKLSQATKDDIRDDLMAQRGDLIGDIDIALTKFQMGSEAPVEHPRSEYADDRVGLAEAIFPEDAMSQSSYSNKSDTNSVYNDALKDGQWLAGNRFTSAFFIQSVQNNTEAQPIVFEGMSSLHETAAKSKKTAQHPRMQERCFACPYHKFNSEDYKACKNWHCQTIENVKRHVLGPKHRLSPRADAERADKLAWLGIHSQAEDRWQEIYARLFDLPEGTLDNDPRPYHDTVCAGPQVEDVTAPLKPHEDLQLLKLLREHELHYTIERLDEHLQKGIQDKETLFRDQCEALQLLNNIYTCGTSPEEAFQSYPGLSAEDEVLSFGDLLTAEPTMSSAESPDFGSDMMLELDWNEPLNKVQVPRTEGSGHAIVPEHPCTCGTRGNIWCGKCDTPDTAYLSIT